MPETIKGESVRIRYEGIFDWNELYSLITGWFDDKKYDYYENKNVKKAGTYGYEKEYGAHAEREESGYVRHNIDIDIHFYHGEDFEVPVNGKKQMKTKTGMMVIEITPSVDFDWQEKWSKGFKKKTREFFHKYIVSGYAQEQADKIYYEAYKLHTKIKEVLNMEGKYSAY